MGFDLDTQRSGTITGFGMIEAGTIDFSAISRTVDVPTRMTKCLLGFGIAKSKSANDWQGLVATTDGDVSSGNITFQRQTAYYDETLPVFYVMLGY